MSKRGRFLPVLLLAISVGVTSALPPEYSPQNAAHVAGRRVPGAVMDEQVGLVAPDGAGSPDVVEDPLSMPPARASDFTPGTFIGSDNQPLALGAPSLARRLIAKASLPALGALVGAGASKLASSALSAVGSNVGKTIAHSHFVTVLLGHL